MDPLVTELVAVVVVEISARHAVGRVLAPRSIDFRQERPSPRRALRTKLPVSERMRQHDYRLIEPRNRRTVDRLDLHCRFGVLRLPVIAIAPRFEVLPDATQQRWRERAARAQFGLPLKTEPGRHQNRHSTTAFGNAARQLGSDPGLAHADLIGYHDPIARQPLRERA
ncbi:hypothetical protein [Paraburkholderia sp. ZP32-5]|uniref:hypothetical protein n=1 Tax=Paraburkholderia sp. ZP32-5 TaxID=2883245 RepID=UPI001F3BF892|nr:hypothetical protein [Paraburkholderia sp. ZP32-5]